MRQSSLIGHVIEVFAKFSADASVPADAVIRKFFFERKYLGSKDRKFIADAYFGVIKNYWRLEAIVRDAFAIKEGPAETTLTSEQIVAAYCISFLGMQPEEMQTVFAELDKRKHYSQDEFWLMADRSREIMRLAALPPDERIATAYSFPLWFVERLAKQYPTEDIEPIVNALNDEAPTVLRANTLVSANREELAEELRVEGCDTSFSHLAQNALVLPKRVNVVGLNSFKRGAFEIQDEASQLVAPFAHITKPSIKILDACAGAGGKTLHLAALLRNKGEIYAADVDQWKLEELRKRLRRSTAQNVRIVKPDERQKMLGADKQGWFDLVLLDVPCTGTGTLRRNPGIKWVLTEQMLEELVAKQRSIIEENIGFIKPGGTLLYATCSILKDEGEEQIDWLIQNHPEFVLQETLRTRPDKDGCDGFFAARLVKHSVQ